MTKKTRRIVDTSPVGKRISQEQFAKAIGAIKKMTPKEMEPAKRRAPDMTSAYKTYDRLLADYEKLTRFMLSLKDALISRRAQEPEHSREDHACRECTMLREWLRESQEPREAQKAD